MTFLSRRCLGCHLRIQMRPREGELKVCEAIKWQLLRCSTNSKIIIVVVVVVVLAIATFRLHISKRLASVLILRRLERIATVRVRVGFEVTTLSKLMSLWPSLYGIIFNIWPLSVALTRRDPSTKLRVSFYLWRSSFG